MRLSTNGVSGAVGSWPRKYAAYAIFTIVLGAAPAQAYGGDLATRIEKAVAVLDKVGNCLGTCIRPEELVGFDCVTIIAGFYRGAAVSGEVFAGGLLLETSFGRGFTSCRFGDKWSAPRRVTLTGGSRAVQIGENIDVVILGINWSVSSGIFAVAAFASPTSAPSDSAVKILAFRRKSCAGIDLQQAVLQPDDSVNKALCLKLGRNPESLALAVQVMISKLSALFGR
jgi:hypothetical protein